MIYDDLVKTMDACREAMGEEDYEVLGPASEADIAAAERRLGVVFPPVYRRFLAEYGAAVLAGLGLHGIFEGSDEEFPGVVYATEDFRQRGGPRNFVSVVAFEDCDFILDLTSLNRDGEAPVVIWMRGIKAADQFTEPFVWNFPRLVRRLVQELGFLPLEEDEVGEEPEGAGAEGLDDDE